MDYERIAIILTTIGVLLSCYFELIKRTKENIEVDRQIYEQHFKYEFEQLFEEEKFKNKHYQADDKFWISNTDDYNVPDNIEMCRIIIKFINRSNRFERIIVNGKLKKMKNICNDIVKLTETKNFKWENLRDNSGYERIYNENKELFKSFKLNFTFFYKSHYNLY